MAEDPQVTVLKAEVQDLLNMVEALLYDCCGLNDGSDELDHLFMSTYEDAIDILVASRPDRWEHTPTGARRL